MTRMIEVAKESGAVGRAFLEVRLSSSAHSVLSTLERFKNSLTDRTQRAKRANELCILKNSHSADRELFGSRSLPTD